MDESVYTVWAVANSGEDPVARVRGRMTDAVNAAVRVARSSGDDGAVSVWVDGPAGIVWAAGEMASALRGRGHKFDVWGNVDLVVARSLLDA